MPGYEHLYLPQITNDAADFVGNHCQTPEAYVLAISSRRPRSESACWQVFYGAGFGKVVPTQAIHPLVKDNEIKHAAQATILVYLSYNGLINPRLKVPVQHFVATKLHPVI
jgi:hypothetical protein